MANERITELPIVTGLDGTEWMVVDQSDGAGGYVTRRVQSQDVADLALSPTGVSAGTYGTSLLIPQFTVDEDGRITFAQNVVPTFPGTGTVTSVGLAAPADFSVTNSPVTSSGTLTLDWATAPTGTGAMVRATSPSLVTPDLGTPSAAVLTNATGLPLTTGVTGTLGPTNGGTGLATYAQGDILLATAADTLGKLALGTANQQLRVNAGATALEYFTPSAGAGTVTAVAVATANGFAGTSDGDPSTPTLTLTTTITGILSGNGTAISAASTTGSGDVVLATSPTIATPVVTTSLQVPLIIGGTGAGDDIRISSTSNGTKGTINLGNATDGLFLDETTSHMALGADDYSFTIGGVSWGADFSLHNDDNSDVCFVVARYSDTAGYPACFIGVRSRGTIASPSVVQSGDSLALVLGAGFDGTDYAIAGRIDLVVDGTPGAGDMPGRWVFSTTPDGAEVPVEAMRINSDQSVRFATTIELGHASDTTVSRAEAGVIAVEGVPLYSNIPQNIQSAAYTTVLADAQKHILHPTADNNARTFTIDSNANVPYPIGTAITFINQINTVTIAITSDTMTLAGSGATGSRTLAANGMATALKIASTAWMISGTGIT